MIDFLDPTEESFTVQDFKRQSLEVMQRLRRENKMGIIVGGTNYYIESLIWDFTMHSSHDIQAYKKNDVESETTPELYARLCSLDSETAMKLHPNNRRKILTALHYLKSSGNPLSKEITKQHSTVSSVQDGDRVRGCLRFSNCIGLMIDCSPDVLEKRIRTRVDKMISEGLLEELEDFNSNYYEQRVDKGFETGIFQVLGFKEFENYFSLSKCDRDTKEGRKIYNQAVELLKQRSVRYSKSQLKWISKRILQDGDPETRLKVYRLDSSDLNAWNENVNEPAIEIVQSHLNGTICKYEPIQRLLKRNLDPHRRFVCDICSGKVLIGEICYKEHIKGKQHIANLKKRQIKKPEDDSELVILN